MIADKFCQKRVMALDLYQHFVLLFTLTICTKLKLRRGISCLPAALLLFYVLMFDICAVCTLCMF